MKYLLLLILITLSTTLFAQSYVSPNTYVPNRNFELDYQSFPVEKVVEFFKNVSPEQLKTNNEEYRLAYNEFSKKAIYKHQINFSNAMVTISFLNTKTALVLMHFYNNTEYVSWGGYSQISIYDIKDDKFLDKFKKSKNKIKMYRKLQKKPHITA